MIRLLGRDATSIRRIIIAPLALATVVLGWIGWIQYSNSEGLDLNAATTLWATLSLFTIGGDPVNVPPTLAVARLLAPVAAAAAIFEAILKFGRTGFVNRAAGRAQGHIVLRGPELRVRQFRNGDSTIEVNCDSAIDEPAFDGQSIIRLPSAGWATAANAREATQVVIATGSDKVNLAELGLLLAALKMAEDPSTGSTAPRISIEIDDLATAIDTQIQFATDDQLPARTIEVICPMADAASRSVEETFDASVYPLVIIGDGPMARFVVDATRGWLNRQMSRTKARVWLVGDLGPIVPTREEAAATVFRQFDEINEFFGEIGQFADRQVAVLVSYEQQERTYRVAARIARTCPNWVVNMIEAEPEGVLVSLGVGAVPEHQTVQNSSLLAAWAREYLRRAQRPADDLAVGESAVVGLLRRLSTDHQIGPSVWLGDGLQSLPKSLPEDTDPCFAALINSGVTVREIRPRT